MDEHSIAWNHAILSERQTTPLWSVPPREDHLVTERIAASLDHLPIEEELNRTERKIMTEVLNAEGAPMPTPGRIVWYQTDGRNFDYYLPALVNITREHNLVPEAVEQGLIPDISSATHVHLFVLGGAAPYYEYDVPFDPDGGRRSWRWPERA